MRTDVDFLYGAMDVFVLPSHREGFPRSAMEAAASQLPVVATDIRGCRDVVEHGVNGFLVPVRDPEALAAAIKKLGEDAGMRRRMGEAGRARAVDRFDEARVVDRVLAEYRRVARRKGLTPPEPIMIDRVTIRKARPDDATALAVLHSSGIDSGFLPRLGPRFMRRLYQALIEFDDGLVLVADDGFGPVGFVAGVLDTGHFYRSFLRHHGVAAGWAAVPSALRPSVMSRVWESLRYEGTDSPGAELLAMALIPAVRGQSLGTRLGGRFLEQIAEAGAPEVRVVVGSGNSHAIAAYRKMGFIKTGTIEVHVGDESVVMTWSG
jgi:ribosomal protein S18 acetylase RimI-like enzyme